MKISVLTMDLKVVSVSNKERDRLEPSLTVMDSTHYMTCRSSITSIISVPSLKPTDTDFKSHTYKSKQMRQLENQNHQN